MLNFLNDETENLEGEHFLASKGCGIYRSKSAMGDLLNESFLPADLIQKEDEIKDLWANFEQQRYKVLTLVQGGEATLLHPDGSTFTCRSDSLEDVSSKRESKKERVCGACHLPWSICVVGGRRPDGTPY